MASCAKGRQATARPTATPQRPTIEPLEVGTQHKASMEPYSFVPAGGNDARPGATQIEQRASTLSPGAHHLFVVVDIDLATGHLGSRALATTIQCRVECDDEKV